MESNGEGEREMKRNLEYLHKAAIVGNKDDLTELIGKDPGILDRVMKASARVDNPLHMAAVFGHGDIVTEILGRKPELAGKVNGQGRCPLHLASEKGQVEVVEKILETDPDVCFVRDKDGRTPLHLAAIEGQLEVVETIVRKINIAAWMLTEQKEPILHLCAQHYQSETLKKLVELVNDAHFVNLKDSDGNTILHVLTRMEQLKVIKFLLDNHKERLDVNAKNVLGFTALEELDQRLGTLTSLRIRHLFARHGVRPTTVIHTSRRIPQNNGKTQPREALMLVVTIVATVTFAALANPPGGVFQEDGVHNLTKPYVDPKTKMLVYNETHLAGKAVMGYTYPLRYIYFTAANIAAFTAAMTAFIVLAFGISLPQLFWRWYVWPVTCFAAGSTLVTYGAAVYTIAPPSTIDKLRVLWVAFITGGVCVFTVALAVPAIPLCLLFLRRHRSHEKTENDARV